MPAVPELLAQLEPAIIVWKTTLVVLRNIRSDELRLDQARRRRRLHQLAHVDSHQAVGAFLLSG